MKSYKLILFNDLWLEYSISIWRNYCPYCKTALSRLLGAKYNEEWLRCLCCRKDFRVEYTLSTDFQFSQILDIKETDI